MATAWHIYLKKHRSLQEFLLGFYATEPCRPFLRYDLRHGLSNKRELECEPSCPALPQLSDGKYPFPLLDGGTFMDIAIRAQRNPEWLVQESAALCHAAGFLEADDVNEFSNLYMTASAAR